MRVTGGCSGCFGFGICELATRDSFGAWYPRGGYRTRTYIEKLSQVMNDWKSALNGLE